MALWFAEQERGMWSVSAQYGLFYVLFACGLCVAFLGTG
jgi:hypothetical protein